MCELGIVFFLKHMQVLENQDWLQHIAQMYPQS